MNTKGFTLIETLTYLALLSAVFVITLPAFYLFTAAIEKEKISIIESEESNFISAKISRIISDTTSIFEPLPGESGPTLRAKTYNDPSSEITIGLDRDRVFIKRGNSPKIYLNSLLVPVSSVSFAYIEESENTPASIGFSFIINLRKLATTTLPIAHYE